MIGRILPIFVLLLAGGIFFAYIHPTYTGAVAIQRAKLKSYDSALAAAQTFRQKESELVQRQEALPENGRARMEVFLPDGVDNVQLIVDLNALASRAGMRIADFDINKTQFKDEIVAGRVAPEGAGATDSLEITVSALGSYSAFRTFLEGVEFSLRPMDLVGLTIQDSETGVYTYEMTFRIYWLR